MSVDMLEIRYRFPTGGGFYFSDEGGPSITVSFVAPYGVASFNLTLETNSKSGKFVNVPDKTHYFKLYVSKAVKFKRIPFIIRSMEYGKYIIKV